MVLSLGGDGSYEITAFDSRDEREKISRGNRSWDHLRKSMHDLEET
jgi:hypothetical protein